MFHHALYGEHPYGHPPLGTVESVEKLELAAVRAFWAARYSPRAVTVVVVGDADPAAAAARVERGLAGWSAPAAASPPAVEVRRGPGAGLRVLLVDRPNAPQSEVRIGHVGLAHSAPDVPAAALLEMVLGGSFTSRLQQNLRERHGYTYNARAEFKLWRAAGPFGAQAAVRTDATADAVKETLAELRGIRAPLTAPELGKGRALVAQKIADEWDTGARATLALAELALTDQPLDFFSRLPPLLDALDVARLTDAAARLFLPESIVVVVVGDAHVVEPGLRTIAGAKIEHVTF